MWNRWLVSIGQVGTTVLIPRWHDLIDVVLLNIPPSLASCRSCSIYRLCYFQQLSRTGEHRASSTMEVERVGSVTDSSILSTDKSQKMLRGITIVLNQTRTLSQQPRSKGDCSTLWAQIVSGNGLAFRGLATHAGGKLMRCGTQTIHGPQTMAVTKNKGHCKFKIW